MDEARAPHVEVAPAFSDNPAARPMSIDRWTAGAPYVNMKAYHVMVVGRGARVGAAPESRGHQCKS